MAKSKQIITLVAVTVFLLSYVNTCSAEQITILGNSLKPPKTYLENGVPRGILIEIMQYMDDHLPQSFDYKLYPWKRSFQNALNGEGGIISFSKNKERLKVFDYSEVMYYDEILLVVLKGKEFTFNSMEDLRGKTIGCLRGASYGDKFENGKISIFKSDEDNSGKQRLLKLLYNRIDAAIIGAGKFGFNTLIELDKTLIVNKHKFALLPKPLNRDPNYLGFAKEMNMQGFLQEFNQVLRKANQTGAIQKIIDEYGE